MAFGLVTYVELLSYLFKDTAPPVLSGVEVALWIGNPTDDFTGGAEVSEASYERVVTASGDWDSPSNTIENVSAITFPEALTDWGIITHVVLQPLKTGSPWGGFFGVLLESKEIATGSIPRFAIGDMIIVLL